METNLSASQSVRFLTTYRLLFIKMPHQTKDKQLRIIVAFDITKPNSRVI